MGKFLVGVILGALVAGNANASIISRSFLDEALTDYATNTALDLKANQSDFTDLKTQISDSVGVLRQLFVRSSSSYEIVYNIDPEEYPNTITGAFDLLYLYLEMVAGSILNGWTDSNGDTVFGLRDITEDYYNTTRIDIRQLYNGWDAGNNTSYLGVIGLNDKIGILPEGITVQGMYEGWTRDNGYHPGLSNISDYVSIVEGAYNIRFPFLFTQGSQFTTINGVDYTGPVYPLWKLSEGIDKIGTLPTLVGFCEYDADGILVCAKYPTAEVFGTNDNIGGMLHAILHGFSDGSGHGFLSLPAISTRTLRLSDQIGTLPSEYSTVGAALTAMDAKIDARELPSTSEDGQYVLSAKKVGDTITYTWVRMDLTSEEQAQ